MTPQILPYIDELERLGRTRDDAWQINRAQGALLYQIALVSGARLVVEVGTSYGFSGLFWGAAMKYSGGHVHTIDLNPKKVNSSRMTFAQAGLADTITNHLGDAAQVLPGLSGPIDVVFLDADKDRCLQYLDMIWPKLRAGGSILTDNATTHRADLKDFVAHVRSRDDAVSTEIAVGNGMEWTVKLERK